MDNTVAKIDFVVTWVDGSDPNWIEIKKQCLQQEEGSAYTEWQAGEKRFRDWGMLPYWFRAVEKYAPWVHKIYFVTCNQIPSWLNKDNEKLVIVNHDEFIPKKYLPTFNSHTIEWNLHRIPGLSQQFVYFNDDFFLSAPTEPSDFFREGLPCDFASLNISILNRRRTAYGPYAAMILNDHFNKRDTLNKQLYKWLNPKNGLVNNLRTLVLLPLGQFTGIASDHLSCSLLKSTYSEIWNQETEELDKICSDKFRGFYSISINLVRDWQRVKGLFVNRPFNYGKAFENASFFQKDENLKLITDAILNRQYKVICINDEIDEDDRYDYWGQKIKEAFDQALPEKSSFEK